MTGSVNGTRNLVSLHPRKADFSTTMMSQRPTLGNTLQKLQLIIFLLNVSGGIELTQISIA